ncbi:MAG: four helix bundle protein [Acidobacteria bacterium]|nr:four helix bundle protein [Acidobacteriota bacterium]
MTDNPVLTQSYAFALRVVRLYKYLTDEKKEFVMSKALLAAGTQIGARVKAAQEAEGFSNFIHEMKVALQRASETEYWLELLRDSDYLETKQYDSIHPDCVELMKLLTAITKPKGKPKTN